MLLTRRRKDCAIVREDSDHYHCSLQCCCISIGAISVFLFLFKQYMHIYLLILKYNKNCFDIRDSSVIYSQKENLIIKH